MQLDPTFTSLLEVLSLLGSHRPRTPQVYSQLFHLWFYNPQWAPQPCSFLAGHVSNVDMDKAIHGFVAWDHGLDPDSRVVGKEECRLDSLSMWKRLGLLAQAKILPFLYFSSCAAGEMSLTDPSREWPKQRTPREEGERQMKTRL